MNKKTWSIIGWVLLIGIGVSWITAGYSSWYLLLVPLVYLSFSVSDGSIRKVNKLKKLHGSQVVLLVLSLVVSVAIVFGLLQLANFVINDFLHLEGKVKTASQIVAIILFLYPVKFAFGYVVYKVMRNAKAVK